MTDRVRYRLSRWLSRYRRCRRLGLSPVGAVRFCIHPRVVRNPVTGSDYPVYPGVVNRNRVESLWRTGK